MLSVSIKTFKDFVVTDTGENSDPTELREKTPAGLKIRCQPEKKKHIATRRDPNRQTLG